MHLCFVCLSRAGTILVFDIRLSSSCF